MATVFDLHVHTTKGSGDSSLSPLELVQEAQRLGLQGVCLTEHSGWHDKHDFQRFAQQHDLVLVRALEIETNMGHVLAFGLDGYMPGVLDIRELHRAARRVGGVLIAAHPFRNLFPQPWFGKNLLYPDGGYPATPAQAASHPVFELVDEIEVANGANTDQENLFALEVATGLGKRGTGGSDAHSVQGLGRGVTVFEDEVRSEVEFLEALRAGRFRPAERFQAGQMRLLGEEAGEMRSAGPRPGAQHP